MTTKIEWCMNPDGTPGETWNPLVGCTKISAGCKNCYAKSLHDMRHKAYLEGKHLPQQYAVPFERVQLMPERLEQPLHWRKPRRVFVNSMSDLFHFDAVNHPDWSDFITRLWLTMMRTPQHTYMILTKRPALMEYEVKLLVAAGMPVLPNVWLGTSVSTQPDADKNIPYLLQTPAAVRFVSCEPLLGPVDLTKINVGNGDLGDCLNHKINRIWDEPPGVKPWGKIDWVIAGGESGPNARPCHPGWVRSLRDHCQEANTAFFFKQWGEWIEFPGPAVDIVGTTKKLEDGTLMVRVGKARAGRLLDGQTYDQFPEPRS